LQDIVPQNARKGVKFKPLVGVMHSSEGQENSVSKSSIIKFDDEGDAPRQHNPNFAVIERTLADVTKQQEELSTRM
jgi:hypothetical protein